MKNKGFTLIEIVLVILITSILVVLVFQALDSIRNNEARAEQKRDDEKRVYILFNSLSNLFKNISSYKVFDNREESYYFLGRPDSVLFLSRSPIIFPYPGLYFVEIRFDKGAILYREKAFREENSAASFETMEDDPYFPLLEDVEALEFQYYLWDHRTRRFLWKSEVNSFDGDGPPLRVLLGIRYGGKVFDMSFDKKILDKNEEIPPQLFRQ